jgi:hypothetical protein
MKDTWRTFAGIAALAVASVGCSSRVRVVYAGRGGETSAMVSKDEAALLEALEKRAPRALRDNCSYWRNALATTPRELEHARALAQRRTEACTLIEDFDASAAARDAFVAEALKGYVPVGETRTGRVEKLAGVTEIPVERGRCYKILYRFAPDVEAGDDLLRGARFKATHGGTDYMGGMQVKGRVGVVSLDCPRANATAIAEFGSRQTLGTGTYDAQLYARPVSDAQLEASAAANERAAREMQRDLAQSKRAACHECLESARFCGNAIDRALTGRQQPAETISPSVTECVRSYFSCLEAHGTSPAMCSR